MNRLFLTGVLLGLLVAASVAGAQEDNGIVAVKSAHSVKDTLDKLEAVLKEKGMTVFARVNHTAGAKKAGMQLRDTELLIFGNPKVGTPLMLCSQSTALDLPQKALAWADESGQVWLGYNDPEYLNSRHGLGDCAEVLKKVSGALGKFVAAATQ